MTRPISDFPVLDEDEDNIIHDLGTLTYNGVTLGVHMNSFADEECPGEYSYFSADLFLQRTEGTSDEAWRSLLDELYWKEGLVVALQAFMEATVEGESNVGWGESGMQSEDQLAFGRNGW